MQQQDRQPPALWQQLQHSAAVLDRIRRGVSGTVALQDVPDRLRPGVQALSYQVLRHLGQAQAVRDQLVQRQPAPALDALLCTALALAPQQERPMYDAHTWVHQAVEAARRSRRLQAQAGFLNACLRRFLRERSELLERVQHDPVACWNYPAWWIQRLQADHPEHWMAVLRASQLQAPLTLRVNTHQISRDQFCAQLQAAGIAALAVGASGVQLQRPQPVQQLPGYAQGWFSVQDAAAQLAAPLLAQGLPRAARVLDACAAPGGKTAHLLELLDCELTAIDIDATRCARITENLTRLQLQAQVLAADAADPATWWDGRLFDAVMLDAPCSASGIVRRHPDIRWLRRATDIESLAAVQARLLHVCWGLLAPGGRLLYSTCSVFRAEGQSQVQAFLAHNNDARMLPAPGHLLPQAGLNLPAVRDNPGLDHDGFYYALLEKTGA